MPIKYHPSIGQMLLCDFSKGFKEPEMVKDKRPVIVISPNLKSRDQLVTVVALSTRAPSPIMPYHYQIPMASMPQLGRFQRSDSWLKGDMIYTVGFHRVDLIRLNKRDANGQRAYFTQKLGRAQMKSIYSCVLHGINLGQLTRHLDDE